MSFDTMTSAIARRKHSPLSDPGPHRHALGALGRTPERIAQALQGLLLHDWAGAQLYGTPPKGLDLTARTTLPASERLARILARDPRPLDAARPLFEREVGTCRDFALLCVTALREAGFEAQVRCGFADYLGAAPNGRRWEDHWLAVWRPARGGRWRMLDAQIDAAHRQAFGIDFPMTDVPPARFMDAARAWQAMRNRRYDDTLFGHGTECRGLWFLYVNLMRDALAREEILGSPWDDWRQVPPEARSLDAGELERADRIAASATQPETKATSERLADLSIERLTQV